MTEQIELDLAGELIFPFSDIPGPMMPCPECGSCSEVCERCEADIEAAAQRLAL